MAVSEQLERERRLAPPAAAAAVLAALCALGSFIAQSGVRTVKGSKSPTRDGLLSIHAQPGEYMLSAVLQAVSTLLLAAVLVYLYTAVRARRPTIPRATLFLAIIAPVALAAVTIVSQVHAADIATQFVHGAVRTERHAKDLASHGVGPALFGIQLASTFALALAFVLISINAMRAGLFNTPLGVVGIVIGIGMVLLGYITVVLEVFWLPAIALLALDRWPGGRGPAWALGEATPWPKPPGRGGGGGLFQRPQPDAEPEPEPEPPAVVPAAGDGASTRTRNSRKRKRKRR